MPRHPVPVFPLPGTVLFPQVRIPVHVFELRYRTMVRDALSRERLLALALLKPGWEQDYHGSPEFHPTTCLARIEEVEWLPNDCYNLVLCGTCRARVSRIVGEFPYRSARVEVLEQDPYPEDDPLVRIEKQALAEAFERLLAAAAPGQAQRIDRDAPYEAMVNTACMAIDLAPDERYALLEMDSVIDRGRQVREHAERLLRVPVERRPKSPPPGAERN